MTVFLSEEYPEGSKPRQVTSGIGFYITSDFNHLSVCSGHMLDWTIPLTPEIVYELGSCEVVNL